MRIEEEIICEGEFWLPDSDDYRVIGKIIINNEEAMRVDLYGFLERGNFSSESKRYPVILGVVEKLGELTLLNSFVSVFNISFSGVNRSKIITNMIYSGVHLTEPEKNFFKECRLKCDYLDEWMDTPGITVDTKYPDEKHTISYSKPKAISSSLEDGTIVQIDYEYTLPGYPVLKEAGYTQQAFIKIIPIKSMELSYFTSFAAKLSNFITLSLPDNGLSEITSFSCIMGNKESKNSICVNVFYKSLSSVNKRKINANDMLFKYKNIAASFNCILNKWINSYTQIESAIQLYFSYIAGRQTLIEARFLTLAQSLEILHRNTTSEKYIDEGKYDELVNTLIENCPETHRKWLMGRLLTGNELSLNNRLINLFMPFHEHLGGKRGVEKIARKTTATRNYLTHYSPLSKREAVNGEALVKLIFVLEIVILFHLYTIAGLNNENFHRLLTETANPLKMKLGYALSKTEKKKV
ncbi:hypothetical protein IAE30_27515 [Pantoea sp. S61]|uniref:ApeA N-terminal domain 1-containing protein n=1 Tax=Pantoea sp. S61 TaxID=2767442 RepID=UPI00190D9275|nr:HEPN domain-containing protein [Pantoea sp. S61]MBK0127493.1 hypothetical protein [Pantoea sp. S61]